MDEDIKLSKYADDLVDEYNKKYSLNCEKIITYLNSIIEDDLYEKGKSQNSVEVYKNLLGWLLKFYPNELAKAFEINGFNYDDFKRYMICCLIITFFRNNEKAHVLYDTLKEQNIVNRFVSYDGEKFELYTTDYGVIAFYSIESFLKDNPELLKKHNEMKDRIVDGCHEISEFLIKTDEELVALTGVLTNPLEEKIFHSIVMDDQMVLDIPNGMIMSSNDYFKLNAFQKVAEYSYDTLKVDDAVCKKYDESKTLYPLLRCMLYKLYMNK